MAKKNKAKGRQLGRPKGSIGKSKLDGKEDFIKAELYFKISVAGIARKLGCSRGGLINFINTRKLREGI